MAVPLQMGSAIFLLAANLISNPVVKVGSQRSLRSSKKIPHLESKNIRESTLDFTAHLREINPGIPIFVDEATGKDSRFSSSSSIWEKSMKKS